MLTLALPGEGKPMTTVRGTTYRVSTAAELIAAVDTTNTAGTPATILIEDGTYELDIWHLNITCDGLVVRSASGDRSKVLLRGPDEGPTARLRNTFTIAADNVLIADISLGYCRWHGIQARGESPYDVSGLHVHNCRLLNCNEQFIKGSGGEDLVGITDGIIENCLFEFTSGQAYQYYTGGIDIHRGVNWTVRDNLFRNIRNPGSGITEHAIHFWKRSSQPQNVILERNWIINCDRGIGFGLTADLASGHNGGDSIIRNNMIYNDGTGPNTDVGIGLENCNDTTVDNNTVYVIGYPNSIEYRFAATTNITIRNNLINGLIRQRSSAPDPTTANNNTNAQTTFFRDLAAGDLRLLPDVPGVIDSGIAITGFADDFEGDPRPTGSAWDIGADEYNPATADSDGDSMTDEFETTGGLDPLNGGGNDGPDGDPDKDLQSNLQEFFADTDPTDSNSRLRVKQIEVENDGLRIHWEGGIDARQTLEFTTSLNDPDSWEILQTISPPTLTQNSHWTIPPPSNSCFYRLRVSRP